jgi:hypothetical protein
MTALEMVVRIVDERVLIYWHPKICPFAMLLEYLENNSKEIHSVGIYAADFSNRTFKVFLKCIENQDRMILKIVNCGLDSSDVIEIAEKMQENPNWLKELDLKYNFIHCIGVEKISEPLKLESCILESLDLSYLQIDERGFQALANALRINKSIKSLKLVNCLRKEYVIIIADALKKNSSILELIIGLSMIEEEGFEALSELIAENQCLRKLDMDKAFIGFKTFDLEMNFARKMKSFNYSMTSIVRWNSTKIDHTTFQNLSICPSEEFSKPELGIVTDLSFALKRNMTKTISDFKFEIILCFKKHCFSSLPRQSLVDYNLVDTITRMVI